MGQLAQKISEASSGLVCNFLRVMKKLRAPQSEILLDQESHFREDFPFPAICKTLEAGGSADSHSMGIVFNRESALEWTRPCLLQEYINHDATIFKVFTIGDYCLSVTRPSLVNFEPSDREPPLKFNSQKMQDVIGNPEDYQVPAVDQNTLEKISQIISNETGAHLVGYDLIRCTKTGEYAIIDMNFFPGYVGVEEFNERLLELIENLLNQRQN